MKIQFLTGVVTGVDKQSEKKEKKKSSSVLRTTKTTTKQQQKQQQETKPHNMICLRTVKKTEKMTVVPGPSSIVVFSLNYHGTRVRNIGPRKIN